MLEVAASPAYKDLLEVLGKLAQWTEEAGKGSLPSGPPPAELVREFSAALENAVPAAQAVEAVRGASPADAAQPAVQSAQIDMAMKTVATVQPAAQADVPVQPDVTPSADGARRADMVGETAPSDVVGESDLFRSEGKSPPRHVDDIAAVDAKLFEGQRRAVGPMTESQTVNVGRGLAALTNAADAHHTDFLDAARRLSALLSRSAEQISPVDLIQMQRLVGVLKVDAESGKKVSEGVSDTLEQLLEQQG